MHFTWLSYVWLVVEISFFAVINTVYQCVLYYTLYKSFAKVQAIFGLLLNFQDISGISLNFQDISGISLNFQDVSQDCGVGVGDFIPRPGFLYLFRSRNTFSNWKKKKSRMGNVKNFPLTTMGVFPDQEWKIPRKSWNSISIFYSVWCFP